MLIWISGIQTHIFKFLQDVHVLKLVVISPQTLRAFVEPFELEQCRRIGYKTRTNTKQDRVSGITRITYLLNAFTTHDLPGPTDSQSLGNAVSSGVGVGEGVRC